jgi:transcriptional regulator with XRE-family HTH domain
MAHRTGNNDVDIKVAQNLYESGKKAAMNEMEQLQYQLEGAKFTFEMAGKVKAFKSMKGFSDLALLILLRQAKESKIYRSQYNMTWDQFCEYVGIQRKTADRWLNDIAEVSTDFLGHLPKSIGLEFNNIKHLSKAISDNLSEISYNSLIIGGREIPLDSAHGPEIVSAINELKEQIKSREHLLGDKQAKLNEANDKRDALEEEIRDLKNPRRSEVEEKFVKKMEALKLGFDGYLLKLDPDRVKELFPDTDPAPTKRMQAAYISALQYMRMQVLTTWDRGTMMYGDAISMPEESPISEG